MDKHQVRLYVILGILLAVFVALVIGVIVLLFVADERSLRDVQTGTTVEERREERAEEREERREERQEEREENGGGVIGLIFGDQGVVDDLFSDGDEDGEVVFDTGTTDSGTNGGGTSGGSSGGTVSGGSTGGTSGGSTTDSGGTNGTSTGDVAPDSESPCRSTGTRQSCGGTDLDGDGAVDSTVTDPVVTDPGTANDNDPAGPGGTDTPVEDSTTVGGTDGVLGSDGNGNIKWITADNWIGFIADEEASVYYDIGGNQIKDPNGTLPIVTIAYQLTRPTELETDAEAYERNKQAILSTYVTYQAGRRELIDGISAETYGVMTRTGAEWVYFLQVSRYIVHIHLRPVGGTVDGGEVIQSIDFYPSETFINSARRVQ